jgi:hypothetical protein
MTIPFPPPLSPEAQRLRDLEVFTREYSEASRRTFGLGSLPAGLLALAAAGLLHLGWALTAAVLALAVPPALVAGGALVRRRYQRLGSVKEEEQGAAWRFVWLLMIAGLAAMLGDKLWLDLRSGASTEVLAIYPLTAVSLLATGALLRWLPPRRIAAEWGLFIFILGMGMGLRDLLRGETHSPHIATALLALLGLVFTLYGTWSHLRHRQLERKLAGLGSPETPP